MNRRKVLLRINIFKAIVVSVNQSVAGFLFDIFRLIKIILLLAWEITFVNVFKYINFVRFYGKLLNLLTKSITLNA